MKTTINEVSGRRIWDSRGRPTIEVEISLVGGVIGRGNAPAGASRGRWEAVDLRDGGSELGGQDVQNALHNINGEISQKLIGMDVADQAAIDRALIELDGTPQKARLGGNAMIATSLAALSAFAKAERMPIWRCLADKGTPSIPLPEIQIFGGGAHAGRRVDIQDFLIMPIGAKSFAQAMEMTSNVYHAAGALMVQQNIRAGVADEGGWWPNFASNEAALDTLALAIKKAGYDDGKVVISLDIAASEFASEGSYKLALEDRTYDRDEWLALLEEWIRIYPIASIEDPVSEEDVGGMQAFTKSVGQRIQVIGDDYLVTNADRIRQAQEDGACNAALIKPNQAGTLTETKAALDAAKNGHWRTVVSARSGETEDVSVAHLAVGWDARQLKVGSFARSERMAKWNEVLRIEEALGQDAHFAGVDALQLALKPSK